jgi:hypothetical protein
MLNLKVIDIVLDTVNNLWSQQQIEVKAVNSCVYIVV